MSVSVLRWQRDLGPMSILSCPHPVSALPAARSIQQIVFPAIHGVDGSAPPERPSARPRRLAAPPRPPSSRTGRPPRTSGVSGPDRGKPADGQPPSFCRPRHPRTPCLARQTTGHCHRLDIADGVGAGYRQSQAAGQPVLLPGPHRSRVTGRNQHGADGRRPGTPLLARATPKRDTRRGRRLP
jgi:hypothetical protein